MRPIVATLFSFFVIVAIQAGTKNGIQYWLDFLTFFRKFPQTDFYRDNSVHSVIYNLLNFFTFPFHVRGENLLVVTQFLSMVIAIVLIILFSIRWCRIASGALLEKAGISEKNLIPLLESLPLILLISPLVWEHHYVLIIPYTLWLLTRKNIQQNGLAFLGAFLVFAIPTFDLFPFSFIGLQD